QTRGLYPWHKIEMAPASDTGPSDRVRSREKDPSGEPREHEKWRTTPMTTRFRLLLSSLLILTLCVVWLVRLDAEAAQTTAQTTDKAIANFALRDTAGRAVALG